MLKELKSLRKACIFLKFIESLNEGMEVFRQPFHWQELYKNVVQMKTDGIFVGRENHSFPTFIYADFFIGLCLLFLLKRLFLPLMTGFALDFGMGVAS